jgi:hypothetical protein
MTMMYVCHAASKDCAALLARHHWAPNRWCGLILMVLLVQAVPTGILLAEPTADTGFTRSWSPEHGLHGWQVLGGPMVTDQDAIVLAPSATLLYSEYRQGDFVLECDYEVRGGGERGLLVYVRGLWEPQQSAVSGTAFQLTQPVEYQAVGRSRWGRHRYRTQVVPGWQRLRLQVAGDQVTIYVNGQLVQRTGGVGPAVGYLALEVGRGSAGPVAVRNLQVTETRHQALFNEQDLAGWEGAAADAATCWEVRDGQLWCTGEKGTWLRSGDTFGDFNLRLEYLVQPGGNSGVYIRVPPDGNHHGDGSGIEVQILDDTADRYADLKPYQFSASLYAIAPATERVARPPGQWNSLEIDCVGTRYQVIHNGVTVVDASEEQFSELASRLTSGYLGLQNHNEPVAFRHLRIGRPLPK